MAHAIYVRDIGRARVSAPRLLAYDIACISTAKRLVTGIVQTYPNRGVDPISDVNWYWDADGLHELWATPIERPWHRAV